MYDTDAMVDSIAEVDQRVGIVVTQTVRPIDLRRDAITIHVTTFTRTTYKCYNSSFTEINTKKKIKNEQKLKTIEKNQSRNCRYVELNGK